jgi:transcriptional regulator with XRE-family HTH domain
VENWKAALGARLRKAREDVPLTQAELASLLEVGQTTVSAWESGRAVPRDNLRPGIARHLGQPARDLFAYEDDVYEDEDNGQDEPDPVGAT